MRIKSTILTLFLGTLVGFGSLSPGFRFGSRDSRLSFDNSSSFLVVDETITGYTGTLRLKDDSPGRIVGSEIVFNNGILSVGSEADLSYTGSYDPVKNDEIELEDGGAIEFLSAKEINKTIKVPAGVTGTVSGFPILKKPIELADATSTLRLAMKSAFDQDIHLNGGTIILDDNFGMTANRKIYGGGTIDVNFKSFQMPGGDFSTGPLTFLNAQDIETAFNINLSTNVTFSGPGGSTELRGFSFTIDFDPGGKITVLNDHIVYWANSNFRDFGLSAVDGIFDIDSTSTMVFQNCCFVMAGDYTHSSGVLTFRDNCVIVTEGHNFNVTSTGIIRIDGAPLVYDNLGGTQDNPFNFTDQQSQKVSVNGGVIRSKTALRSELRLFNTSISMKIDMHLDDESPITLVNETPASPKAVTFDLNGYSILFPTTGSNLFNLDPNVNLTVQNVVLDDFNKDAVSYGDANATLEFGTGTQIRLFDDVTVGGADKDWDFTGDGLISGRNVTLELDGANKLTVTGSSTLTLRDLRIVLNNIDSLAILDAGSKVVFENCTLVLKLAGFDITTGSIDVKGVLDVLGGDPAAVETDSKLTFSSLGDFTVLSGSMMRLGKNVEFEYKADPSGDAGVTFDTKRHFKLADPTSTLELDGCTVRSTVTGLALDYGRLVVTDTTSLISEGSSGTEAEIGSALDLIVRPSVSLDVTGTLTYNLTTFP